MTYNWLTNALELFYFDSNTRKKKAVRFSQPSAIVWRNPANKHAFKSICNVYDAKKKKTTLHSLMSRTRQMTSENFLKTPRNEGSLRHALQPTDLLQNKNAVHFHCLYRRAVLEFIFYCQNSYEANVLDKELHVSQHFLRSSQRGPLFRLAPISSD